MGYWKSLAIAGFPAFSYMFTVGSIGFWLPLYVQEALGYTHSQAEYLATAYFIALAIGGVLAGAFTDRGGKPWLTASTGLALNAASIILMAETSDFTHMILLRLLQGLGLSTAIPVALGSLSLIAGESAGVGLNSLFMSAGMALGSLAGGLLIWCCGYRPLFSAAALISVAGAVLALGIRIPPRSRPARLLEALAHIRGPVIIVLAGIFARQLFATGVYALLAVILRRVLGLSLLETAVALTVNPVVQGVLSIYLARMAERSARIMYPLGIALTSIVFAMLSASTGRPGLAIASMIVQGVSFAAVNIAGNYLVITGLPSELRYTASSLFGTFFNVGWIAGTGLAGVALSRVSPVQWIRLCSAAILLVAGLVYLGLETASRAHSRAPRPEMQA